MSKGLAQIALKTCKKKNRFSRCFGASGSTTPSSVPAQKLRNGNVPYFCCAAWVTDFWRQRWSATMQWLVLDFLTSCCFFGAWMIHLDGFQNDDSRFNLGGIPPRNRHQEYYIYIYTSRWFQIYFIHPPNLGEMIQRGTHIFQMGWNHQLTRHVCQTSL